MLKRYLVTLAVVFNVSFSLATAQVTLAPKGQILTMATRSDINLIIARKAWVYGVSEKTLHAVISCESQYNPLAVGDGGHSRGLVQIYDNYHPDITHAQAFDPEFAVGFLAKEIKNGNGDMWTCARMLGIAK